MIIDTGGVLLLVLVLAVPIAVYVLQRGKRSRTSDLLARIAAKQRELDGQPGALDEIRGATTQAELDRAVRRRQIRDEIAALTARLPAGLRSRIGDGT